MQLDRLRYPHFRLDFLDAHQFEVLIAFLDVHNAIYLKYPIVEFQSPIGSHSAHISSRDSMRHPCLYLLRQEQFLTSQRFDLCPGRSATLPGAELLTVIAEVRRLDFDRVPEFKAVDGQWCAAAFHT
jgi:hypothetical protein